LSAASRSAAPASTLMTMTSARDLNCLRGKSARSVARSDRLEGLPATPA
jgi:hypothetical protein